MGPGVPAAQWYEIFSLPRESMHYHVVTGTNIPYFHRVIGVLPTTRGSGTDVQGSHPLGGLKGVRPVYWLVTVLKSPRRFLCRFNTDRLRRFATDQTAEHKVPNHPIPGSSADRSDSNRNDYARPPAGIPDAARTPAAIAAHGSLNFLPI